MLCLREDGTTSSDEINITVGIDLDMEDVAEADEQNPGGYICLNDDDDDRDGVIDYDDGYNKDGEFDNEDDANADEDDLVKITIQRLHPADPARQVRLSKTDPGARVKVWSSPTKGLGNEIVLPKDYSVAELPKELWVEGVATSGAERDVELKVAYATDGLTCSDTVKVTVVEVGWDDAIPDYTMDDDPEAQDDSDNFFLRQGDDAKVDLYWHILPADMEPDSVQINMYEENAGSGISVSGVPQTAGPGRYVEWDARSGGQYRNAGYYRAELEVRIESLECKTPIDDADTEYPGWQCPQKGLGIHDLIWKHRPVVHMGAQEEVAPKGPCYPFDPGVIGHGSQEAPNYRLREGGSEAWGTEPNYSEWGEFPLPAANFSDESYRYPVLQASANHPPTADHAIDMFGQDEGGLAGDEPIIQEGVPVLLGYHGIPEPGGTNNHVFIHWWMYETASYAPYGSPGAFVHDADWEMLQLCIELQATSDPSSKARWLEPWAATASQHYYGQTLAWRRDKEGSGTGAPLTRENQRYVRHSGSAGNRILVYIAENAHATYFQSGEIDVDVDAQTGTQCQYDNNPELAYDACQAPLVPLDEYPVISLVGKDGAGIYDWAGRWGTHHDWGLTISGPAFREANPNIVIANDPVTFHNRCRKHVDEFGNFDEDGADDPETQLWQVP